MKHRTGYLFKRGTAFYLRWTVKGKIFSQALRDDKGTAITSLKDAQTKRVEIMQGFTVGDEVSALESIAGKLAARQADAAAVQDSKNLSLRIQDAWYGYVTKYELRDRGGDLTLTRYEGHWKRFLSWMATAYPEVEYLRDVTETIAVEYASDLSGAGLGANSPLRS